MLIRSTRDFTGVDCTQRNRVLRIRLDVFRNGRFACRISFGNHWRKCRGTLPRTFIEGCVRRTTHVVSPILYLITLNQLT